MKTGWLYAALAISVFAGAGAAEIEPSQVPEDLDLLEANGLALARKLLTDGAGMLPFAFVVRQDGSVQRIVPSRKRSLPPPEELFGALEETFRQNAEQGAYRAVAIFADVVIARPGQAETDAIHARIAHRSGYCADVYHPYSRAQDGTLSFADRVATRRPGGIFGRCTVEDTGSQGADG